VRRSASPGERGGQTMAGSKERTILVVEDEEDVRSLVSDVLRHEGFEVEEAQDGAQALAVLERERAPERQLCAVLLDVMLPRIDGVSLLRRLRVHGPAVPVVAMSASEEYLLAAVTAGARGALAKPFDIDHLVDVVRRACA
jgi:two-component system, OmpR family, response regulator PrrA